RLAGLHVQIRASRAESSGRICGDLRDRVAVRLADRFGSGARAAQSCCRLLTSKPSLVAHVLQLLPVVLAGRGAVLRLLVHRALVLPKLLLSCTERLRAVVRE